MQIHIPASLTALGLAFQSSGIQQVTFEPESKLEKMEYRSFWGCQNLAAIIGIPANVVEIEADAFRELNALESVTFEAVDHGSRLLKIGTYAFYYSRVLSSIRLPASLVEISTGAFQGCAALAEVYIPAHGNLTTLADSTFYTCSSLRALSIPHGVTAIPSTFCRDCTSLVNLSVPATVTSIGVNAFLSCAALEAVDLVDSESSQLQIISTNAFYGCASLRSITIPALVTDIQSSAFYAGSSLSTVSAAHIRTRVSSLWRTHVY